MSRWTIRPATELDRSAIVHLWHLGWHDAHRDLVPKEILSHRKPEHFQLWLDECMAKTVVAADLKELGGLYSLSGTGLSKLYVSQTHRGGGLASMLLAHAEHALFAGGIRIAELFCTDGNHRAQRFYERHGWTLTDTFMDPLWLPNGDLTEQSVAALRYEKQLKG